ncbi:MAG: MFS transporter [Candidatus Pacebacteria bacterium]|nr:MFS transporter [Candidatus Paceibacterota bacterium]
MEQIFGRLKNIQAMLLIFISVLLLSFHFFFVYFINSKYLEGILSGSQVGFTYTAGALVNIILIICAPHILRRFGNYRFTLFLGTLELLALLGLALTPITSPIVIIGLFIAHQAFGPTLFYCMDIFTESFSTSEEMGNIRGIYLTMQNVPPIITPAIVGLILIKPEYWKVYLIGALFLIPFLILVGTNFKNFKDSEYPVINLPSALKKFYADKNVYNVFVDHFLLHLFYSWTVIYLPIYLIEYIGFSWSEVGVILSVMLLPFIIFQIPIGRMEDKYQDEKHVLVLGFGIMAASFMLIPFIHEKSLVLWAAVLFVSRIGASIVEVSGESYFFKHVNPSNAGFISFFRMTRSLPYFIIPPIVGLILLFTDFSYIFFVAGLFMLIGVRYALLLKK